MKFYGLRDNGHMKLLLVLLGDPKKILQTTARKSAYGNFRFTKYFPVIQDMLCYGCK